MLLHVTLNHGSGPSTLPVMESDSRAVMAMHWIHWENLKSNLTIVHNVGNANHMQGASVTFQLSTRIIVSNMCALNDQPGVLILNFRFTGMKNVLC